MKLSTRLSVFFLGMLALVLVGFSSTLYFVARADLYQLLDDDLLGLLNTLTAAAEVEDENVEWKPEERDLALDSALERDEIQWLVMDGGGKQIDWRPQSTSAAPEHLLALGARTLGYQPPLKTEDDEGQSWRSTARRVTSITGEKIPDPTKPYSYDELVLAAAVSPVEVQARLRWLAWWLAGLSVAIWLVVALIGRWLCRRALWPVTEMATAARGMSATDFEHRLPVPQTHDELQDLGASFNDLLVRLHESYERQQGFTGDASHQLRTPLTAMLGQVEVALRRDRENKEYREILGSVHRQANHLHKIVESLLFLARADKESELESLEPVDLAAWLEEFLDQPTDMLPAERIRIERLSPGPFVVQTQIVLLGELVENLVENALKYSPPEAIVTIELARAADRISLIVRDEGEGIAAADLPQVFEPFYRAQQARLRGRSGHGLGLAIVRRIAKVLGGKLDVQSQLGQGSRFCLSLPAADADAATLTESEAAGETPLVGTESKGVS